GIACDVVERVFRGDLARDLADDKGELHFMIVAAVEFAESYALARAHQRGCGLKEQADLIDWGRMGRAAVVQSRIGPDLLQMLLIVDRGGDDLARVRNGTEQLEAGQGQQRSLLADGADAFGDVIQ